MEVTSFVRQSDLLIGQVLFRSGDGDTVPVSIVYLIVSVEPSWQDGLPLGDGTWMLSVLNSGGNVYTIGRSFTDAEIDLLVGGMDLQDNWRMQTCQTWFLASSSYAAGGKQ